MRGGGVGANPPFLPRVPSKTNFQSGDEGGGDWGHVRGPGGGTVQHTTHLAKTLPDNKEAGLQLPRAV